MLRRRVAAAEARLDYGPEGRGRAQTSSERLARRCAGSDVEREHGLVASAARLSNKSAGASELAA